MANSQLTEAGKQALEGLILKEVAMKKRCHPSLTQAEEAAIFAQATTFINGLIRPNQLNAMGENMKDLEPLTKMGVRDAVAALPPTFKCTQQGFSK